MDIWGHCTEHIYHAKHCEIPAVRFCTSLVKEWASVRLNAFKFLQRCASEQEAIRVQYNFLPVPVSVPCGTRMREVSLGASYMGKGCLVVLASRLTRTTLEGCIA